MHKEQISYNIKIASLICTCFVVLRHSLNLRAFWGIDYIDNYCGFIELGFSTLTEFAVPFFFFISGYFFFQRDYYNFNKYKEMLRKKSKTLLLPFIIWNIIGAIILYIYNPSMFNSSISNITIDFLLGKWNPPLWYVRNLILMMILYPLYGWIFKTSNLIYKICVILALLYFWIPVDCSWYSIEGWLFFIIGGVFTQENFKIKISSYILYLLIVIWILLCFYKPYWNEIIHKATTILGVSIIIYIINSIKINKNELLYKFASYSFLIYVAHIYMVKSMKVLIANKYPENEITAILSYFTIPIICIFFILIIGNSWKKIHSKSYSILMGGRT